MLLQFDYVTIFSLNLIMQYFLYNSPCNYYMWSQRQRAARPGAGAEGWPVTAGHGR
jgi:hypothetical protein